MRSSQSLGGTYGLCKHEFPNPVVHAVGSS
jgi:hypothetical protein